MAYSIIKYILKFYLPLFFKKVKVNGLESVPQHLPIVFAPNHQNTFLDAVLVAFSIRKNVYFLVRSDLFKKGIVTKIFKAIYLIPIHRSENYSNGIKEKNQETFKTCQLYLEKKEPILIFPEGNSRANYRLSPLKKGVSRLAFQAEEQNAFKLNLQVIPVTINYENHFSARKTVWIDYKEHIAVREFKEDYRQNPSNAIQKLTNTIKTQLSDSLLIEKDTHKAQSFLNNGSEKFNSGKSIVDSYRAETKLISSKSKNSKLARIVIKALFFPTFLSTNLILKKVNDKDFSLSIKCFSWLVFGFLQFSLLLMALIFIYNILFAIITTSSILLLSIVLIKLC